jgi:putative flippase GtrA
MSVLTKRDYLLISIIGLAIGLLLLPILANIKLSFLTLSPAESVAIVIGLVLFSIVALWLSYLISKAIPVFLQMAKYVAIGALNTLIDLGVLNALILLSGFASGLWYVLFKSTSFIVANINSYFWNKYWTFDSKKSINVVEVGQFFIVSLIGFAINIGIASLIVNFIPPIGSISPARWANVGAIMASIIALAWNYIGYKFVVFKTKS